MNILKFGGSSIAIIIASGIYGSVALAGCPKGEIEVTYAGAETCVAPEQFATLSDAVKATADQSDVADALEEDDSGSDSEGDADGDSSGSDSAGDADGDSSGSDSPGDADGDSSGSDSESDASDDSD